VSSLDFVFNEVNSAFIVFYESASLLFTVGLGYGQLVIFLLYFQQQCVDFIFELIFLSLHQFLWFVSHFGILQFNLIV